MITLLLLALATQQDSQSGSLHRQVTRLAALAVEGDSVAAERRRWIRRLSSDSTDRLALLHLATLDRLTYRHAAAESGYSRIRQLSTANDDIALSASLGIVETSFFTRPYDRGEQLAAEAEESARSANNRSLRLEALVWRAWYHSRWAGPTAGSRILESSRSLLAGADAASRSWFHCMLGYQMLFEGRAEADAETRRGLDLARRSGDRRIQGKCYQVLAGHALNRSSPSVTLALFDSALALHRAAGDRSEAAGSLNWRAFYHLLLFDHEAARRDLAAAVAEGEAIGDAFVLAWAPRHQAHLEWHTGELSQATASLTLAFRRLRAIGDSNGLNSARDILVGVALDRNDFATAERTLRENLSAPVSAGYSAHMFSNLNALAQSAMKQGRWAEAATRISAAAAYGRANGLDFWLEGLRYDEAVIALRLGRYDQAERLLRRYLAASGDQRLDRYSARSRLAELYLLRGNPIEAEREITAATDELEALRHSLDHQRLRVYLFQTHRGYDDPDAGFANIIAGLVQAERIASAFALVERRRARHLADRLLQPGEGPGVSGDPARRLVQDGRTAFVEYLTGRGSPTTVFIRTRERLTARVLPQADTLALSMKRAIGLLESGAELASYGAVLRQAWLDPVLVQLPAPITRIIFALDGPLHHLPLEALPLSDGTPLLSRYTISIVPSAAIAERLVNQGSRGAVPGAMLAFGDPAFAVEKTAGESGQTEVYRSGYAETGGLVRLPGSAREVRRVARFSSGSVTRFRSQASEAFLKRASLDSYQVVHFATHALVNEQSATRTSLALAPGDGEDGFLGIEEIGELKLGADLVVLSGCGTAGGEVVSGEGILGLTGPLLGSGARAVVATMWRIGDESAITLVELLYRGLADGLSVGEALQQAKLEAFRRGIPAREWAAFVLIGDHSATVQLRPVTNRNLWVSVAALGLLALVSYGLLSRKWRSSDRASVPSASSARTHQR